jgi:hypothetical protein
MDGKERYLEYLKSDHWRSLREKAWAKYGHRCFFHPHRTFQVDIHHVEYRNWTDCTVNDVVPLCRECHEKAHQDESWLKATKLAHENRNQPKEQRISNPYALPSNAKKVVPRHRKALLKLNLDLLIRAIGQTDTGRKKKARNVRKRKAILAGNLLAIGEKVKYSSDPETLIKQAKKALNRKLYYEA